MSGPTTRTLRLLLEYEGTRFHGWQVQPGLRTVQGELEQAFERITHDKVRITGAGRTDAGVHAAGQVASLVTSHAIAEADLARGLNALTGPDVAVLDVQEAQEGFSARFSANGKLYRYCILNRVAPSAMRRRTHLHVRKVLDVDAMSDAAQRLVGTHRFDAFRAADCEREDPTVTMQRCEVQRVAGSDHIHIEVRAPAFLKNMVRIMSGTLVEVGKGRMGAEDVTAALESQDRAMAGPTAPAHGLTLVRVYFGPRLVRP